MERKLQSHLCNVIKKAKKLRGMKDPQVKMGFGFWWRRLEYCLSPAGWVLSHLRCSWGHTEHSSLQYHQEGKFVL